MNKTTVLITSFLLIAILIVGCGGEDEANTPIPATDVPVETRANNAILVTPTATAVYYPQTADEIDYITIAIDAPSRNRDFADIDEFGRVLGFDAGVMDNIAQQLAIETEFVVTPYEGLLASVARGEFDAAMSAIIIPDTAPEGLAFTAPYLEIGQVLMVRANETAVNRYSDLGTDATIGVQANSHGEEVARTIMGRTDENVLRYQTAGQALQALINNQIGGVVLDDESAKLYADSYYQQLRIVGGEGNEAWITSRAYGIAVSAQNQTLLALLNEAITTTAEANQEQQLTWLVQQERLVAGQSLIGTLDREFVLGVVAAEINLDPVAAPDPISWEIKTNTMSGLVRFTADNELVPALAESLPVVSPDGREYTFKLRAGLTFPDGSPLTAADVKYSIDRSAAAANFLVNSQLLDDNLDGFADNDAVQIIDDLTVKIILDEPTSYFLSILATPPYFIASQNCLPLALSPNTLCGGIGPYTIIDWQAGEQIRMEANPQWPGTAPLMSNIQIRFYNEAGSMREAVQLGAIDVAWLGFPLDDILALRGQAGYIEWVGAPIFKSYLVFNHDTQPWNDPRIREMAALAIDRDALSALFQGVRSPLYSPVPDGVPGAVATQPERDLDRAKEILEELGYTIEEPLFIAIDYVNDGRYSAIETEYAQEIERQLEQTGRIVVTLQGAPYGDFRPKTAACDSAAFLFGWPSVGQPPNYIDPAHWINFFVFGTDTLCSNYESAQMDTAVVAMETLPPTDFVGRAAAYQTIQTIWAQEFPTLDLTQERRLALSLDKVKTLKIDAQGLLRYDSLEK